MSYPNKYKAWNNSARKFIEKNYLLMNNSQIAYKLGRTEDSIRKELNKLGLKRPKKSDLPKIYLKRGRKKKILTVSESIERGIAEKRKEEKKIRKNEEAQKRIANEAMWAADFCGKKQRFSPPELINPIVVRVPDYRLTFEINRDHTQKKINSKIAAIKGRYGHDRTVVDF